MVRIACAEAKGTDEAVGQAACIGEVDVEEVWCQMACPYDENGPSKIVTATLPGQWSGADGNLSAESVAVR